MNTVAALMKPKLTSTKGLATVICLSNKKGKEVTYLRSSAELTTGEMTLSIDRFRNWSASVAGIYLPAANEQQMLIYAQQEIERNKEFI